MRKSPGNLPMLGKEAVGRQPDRVNAGSIAAVGALGSGAQCLEQHKSKRWKRMGGVNSSGCDFSCK